MTKNNRTMHRILLSGDMIPPPPPHLNYMINNRSVCIVPMLRMGPWGGVGGTVSLDKGTVLP